MVYPPKCRLCGAGLTRTFIDLGPSPLANALVNIEELEDFDVLLPLRVCICSSCFLVQIVEIALPDKLFSKYVYFSSYSSSWLSHAASYARRVKDRFSLTRESQIVEIASNDGYLLQYFTAMGIPVLGVEPAANIAKVAIDRGIPTRVAFFGRDSAEILLEEGFAANLMPANNVLAHVPDILDFLAGFKVLLKSHGVATFEFPHLLALIEEGQFDTIYHEHFSYLSFWVVCEALRRSGLRAFDVEQLSSHGGSLRVFACHVEADHVETPAVRSVLTRERAANLFDAEGYKSFTDTVATIKANVVDFLNRARGEGKQVCGYGAAAKGTAFLNHCGIGPELVQAVADRSPYKQGTWIPGCRIPVVSPESLLVRKPDYVLVLAWNLKDEIATDLVAIREWGGRFVTAIPQLTVF